MGIALQLLFTGLGIGSIYALVALGFVLIYRATNVVNFAQGDFAMLGAFSMVVLCIDLELPYRLGILITLVAMLVFGALFNLAVFYPLRNRGFQPVIISTIGASLPLGKRYPRRVRAATANPTRFPFLPGVQRWPGLFR
jgi:branched-chain amino acid transport system permease protein